MFLVTHQNKKRTFYHFRPRYGLLIIDHPFIRLIITFCKKKKIAVKCSTLFSKFFFTALLRLSISTHCLVSVESESIFF